MNETSQDALGWNRACVNLRLTKERRLGLQALVGELPTDRSPVSAIDYAIEQANAFQKDRPIELKDQLEEFRDEVKHQGLNANLVADKQATALADIAMHMKGLRDLISAIADQSALDGGHFEEEAQSAREWLDIQARNLENPSLLLRAIWQSKTRVGEAASAWELLVELAAVAGQKGALVGLPALVRIGRVEETSGFAIDQAPVAYLFCQSLQGGGWRMNAHHIKEDGGIGHSIGSTDV